MAVYSHNRVGSRTSVGFGEQELPNGPCNFRDLSIGAKAPVCGCKRFWLNSTYFTGPDGVTERAWCFCGHHACFHNAFDQKQGTQRQDFADSRVIGVEDFDITNGQGVTEFPAAQDVSTPPRQQVGLGIQPGSGSQSQSINTRVWQALNDFARNQEDVSDTTSKLPSTQAPSLIEETRLSPTRIPQERLKLPRPMGPPVNIPAEPAPKTGAEEYSATEVATPSMAGTPDFRALANPAHQIRSSPARIRLARDETQDSRPGSRAQPTPNPAGPSNPGDEPAATSNQIAASAQEVQSIIRAYGQRIEALESLSFSHVAVEEIQDRFDLFDGRLLDIEQWRADSDQVQTSPELPTVTSSHRRRLLPTEASLSASDASFDSSAAAHAEAAVLATLAANAETHPRIDALEQRVVDLENVALPSYARPWQVQVVLLPWSSELRGIWFSSVEATQHSLKSATQMSEEWTGAQSVPKLSFKSSSSGAWTTESIQAWASSAQEWLSPKACGPNGMVFQRLASRGLVRDITLTASDARNILDTINIAFRELVKEEHEAETDEMRRYQGLRESLIPLRKVRKSSRLRFMSPAEMVTSASWTAAFLDSSVFMKVNDGQRRLYVTTPEAYIQPSGPTWSWPKIRELPLVDASGEEQAAQATNAFIEACWTHNDQLDQPTSVHSSFASHESQWSTKSQLPEPEEDDIGRQPMSPRSEARPVRPRTVSLPGSSPTKQVREILPKRRVASFETAATIPIHADESGEAVVAKRRRISLSPEAERRGVNFTPRWSREPPSPFTSEAAAEARSQGTSSRKRGTTPFAYATPHSNNNYVGKVGFLGGDGDTEADTDIAMGRSEHGEEEWEGVEDGTNLRDDQTNRESALDDLEIDEHDLDGGLKIYES